jgi:uncharacterized circularly permuted ATP-grasp superfamily protein
MGINWKDYSSEFFYDELINSSGNARLPAKKLASYLQSLDRDEVQRRQHLADAAIKDMGISFTVYTEEGNIDRSWPFDIIPRTISAKQWSKTEKGLIQRLEALNLFIDDLYHDQKIIKDGIVPRHILEQSTNFRKECIGVSPPQGVWAHICGTDLVRDGDGDFYVLEDNLRVPSGVSYMLENRSIMKRVLPELFENDRILPVNSYCDNLFETLSSLAPDIESPEIVVLTPGIYNSAYFEHAFLAQQMGVELVEGSDLTVAKNGYVYMKTIGGLAKVDVIYRRIDDMFLDPTLFQKDSVLGVPGLMKAWQTGKVALANAPGAGVADDKVVYAYVPQIIKYYLDQDPILPNVETFLCYDKKQRDYVIKNIDKLVVKPANESGGYGMLVGPHSTKKEQAIFVELIKKDPRNYIAQPTLALSTAPTLVEGSDQPEPRHLDLRPFILQGKKSYVTTGGLTRVAMKKGSLVVNSSQGGGSKDTWIVDTEVKS